MFHGVDPSAHDTFFFDQEVTPAQFPDRTLRQVIMIQLPDWRRETPAG